jgi:hypothetical protein
MNKMVARVPGMLHFKSTRIALQGHLSAHFHVKVNMSGPRFESGAEHYGLQMGLGKQRLARLPRRKGTKKGLFPELLLCE